MLNSEDIQLLQDSSLDVENSTVLVATFPNPSTQVGSGSTISTTTASHPTIFGPNVSSGVSFNQSMPSSSQFLPQMPSFSPDFRGFPRGRGNRGYRFPRDPCGICGRTNHITAFCYYNPQCPLSRPRFST